LFAALCLCFCSSGAVASALPRARDFKPLCDSLRVLLRERTSVDNELSITKIKANGGELDLYFNAGLSYYPWHEGDVEWFFSRLSSLWRDVPSAKGYKAGRVFSNRYELLELTLPRIGSSGKPSGYERAIEDPHSSGDEVQLIEKVGSLKYPKGLDSKYIALWQSHGRYYDEDGDCWSWQRAPLHGTVEDMFTQTFVLPFLIPMLENSGAYVLTPRERDIQKREIITDNDPSFKGEREGLLRKAGTYKETGRWEDAGVGFADNKEAYTFEDNPFKSGTARKAACSAGKVTATAKWTPKIEKRGMYAVYISYKTLENSSSSAHYTVKHMGGTSEYRVNQKMGGGTWIYLGTFEFDDGEEAFVSLDNKGKEGSVVSADAVKIGGGMGKILRGERTSGVASSMEGAHYWMQWAGVDTTITRNWSTDYTNDFASRGAWTAMMKEQKGIPIDLALAFHTDAGTAQKDSTIGTLAIYTLRNEGEREFSDGRDRIISRLLCDYVQSQIVSDLRADCDSLWNRRGLWDKSYSECRTAGVPAMILELLSHQNFADMKCGLDPKFRFSVSRAVYKGILKTLSEYYGADYAVQPLPVNSFASSISEDGETVLLEWSPTPDPKEPTARSEGYIVYTRIDGGAFDGGVLCKEPRLSLPIQRGHVYSYKVEAYNKGGRSFPSEILSVGLPENASAKDGNSPVLIVNNFTRVSAPSWIDGVDYAGFDYSKDSGVGYIREIGFIGDVYEHERSAEFEDNDYPGFGASYDDEAGNIIAGNTFDYPYIHGKALMGIGKAFFSMSESAFCEKLETLLPSSSEGRKVLDLICGKQGGEKYPVFTKDLMEALTRYSKAGGNIFISGSNIASDCKEEKERDFLEEVLGMKAATPSATRKGLIENMPFSRTPNEEIYCVEQPDGLKPVSSKTGGVFLRYPSGSFGAAVYYNAARYKVVSMGVPLEVLLSEEDRERVLSEILEYFDGGTKPVHHGKVN